MIDNRRGDNTGKLEQRDTVERRGGKKRRSSVGAGEIWEKYGCQEKRGRDTEKKAVQNARKEKYEKGWK